MKISFPDGNQDKLEAGRRYRRRILIVREHLGAWRGFENRDEALSNLLSSICVKRGRRHPPATTVGDYRDGILMERHVETGEASNNQTKTAVICCCSFLTRVQKLSGLLVCFVE